jgi:hypothetical protein
MSAINVAVALQDEHAGVDVALPFGDYFNIDTFFDCPRDEHAAQ